jgi:hypothetical protein
MNVLELQLLQAIPGQKVILMRKCGSSLRVEGVYKRLLSTAVKTEPNLSLGGVFSSRVMRENFLAS